MIPVAEALSRVLALAKVVSTERLPLAQSHGRVLAEEAVAHRAQPPFTASAMDGYAVVDPVAQGQSLPVIGHSQAGHRFEGTLQAGQAVRIFTGAPIPAGTTRVILQEDVSRAGDQITLTGAITEGRHIRPAGTDFDAGFTMAAGRRLRAADLALLAAMNVATPVVYRKPIVALIATGDEIVMPGEVPGPDQIVGSNLFALKAMAETEGAEVRLLPIARDTVGALEQVLDLASGADIIVTIGGASVGDHDLVGRVVGARGGEQAFYKVAMRPGKPLMAGRLGDTLHLGLPGNPVSAIVCGHLFLLPLVRALQGLSGAHPRPLTARLGIDMPANGPRSHYMRATLSQDAAGEIRITPAADQDSSRLALLCAADALLIRDPHAPPAVAGDLVSYLPI